MIEQFRCRGGCGHIFTPKVKKVVIFKKGFKWRFIDSSREYDQDKTIVREIRRFIFFKRTETRLFYRAVEVTSTYMALRDLCERTFECELCGELYRVRDFIEPREWHSEDYNHLFSVKETKSIKETEGYDYENLHEEISVE